MPNFKVSRRLVLGSLSSGAALSLVGGRDAFADSGKLLVLPFDDSAYLPHGSGRVTALPLVLGGTLLTGQSLSPGSQIQIHFDSRAYRLNRFPSLYTPGGAPLRARWLGRTDATARLLIQQGLEPGVKYLMVLGSFDPTQFPSDIVASIRPTVYALAGDSGRKHEVHGRLVSAPVWAVGVGASWTRVGWANRYHSWVPELVTVASLGPDPIPPECSIVVQLDSRLVSELAIRQMGTAAWHLGMAAKGVASLEWPIGKEIPASQTISAVVAFASRNPRGPLPNFLPPTVFTKTKSAKVGQRTTLCESTQRCDSAFDETTVATFGWLATDTGA